jgi:hypothetical protein
VRTNKPKSSFFFIPLFFITLLIIWFSDLKLTIFFLSP